MRCSSRDRFDLHRKLAGTDRGFGLGQRTEPFCGLENSHPCPTVVPDTAAIHAPRRRRAACHDLVAATRGRQTLTALNRRSPSAAASTSSHATSPSRQSGSNPEINSRSL
jgi:hypothetical protein